MGGGGGGGEGRVIGKVAAGKCVTPLLPPSFWLKTDWTTPDQRLKITEHTPFEKNIYF